MLRAWPYNNIIVRTCLIQRGETADGIVRTDCCWDNGYANVLHGLIIISADGIVSVTRMTCTGSCLEHGHIMILS